jgi:uncharacterized repeat protein (TIGR01451 family)
LEQRKHFEEAMSHRQRIAALLLSLLLGGLAIALTSPLLAAQRPQTPEPPVAPPAGTPGVRELPSGSPGVRDVPTPATPPRVRIIPQPGVEPAPGATHWPIDPPAPVVSIKVRVPACAAPGEDLEYHICVENHGKLHAHHVIVRDPLPANATFVRANPPPTASDPVLEWRLGTLDGCARRDIVLVLKPTGTGDIRNCARVQFEHGQCVVTKISGQPPPVAEPKLTLRKIGPERAILHKSLDYRLIVTNTGTEPARDVQLADTMDEGMRHIASNRSQLTWNPFELPPGASKSFDYQVTTTKTGRLCNRAVLTVGTLRQEATSCVEVFATDFESAAGLTFDVKIADNPVEIKKPTRYTITVVNRGGAAAKDIELTADVPNQMEIKEISPKESFRQLGRQITFQLPSLQAGEQKSFVINVVPTEAAADAAIKVKMTTKELPEGATKEARVNIVPNGEPPGAR